MSSQTVYLWVERRSIPHFRIIGRNIRFLRSDLELFRGSFKAGFSDQAAFGRTQGARWDLAGTMEKGSRASPWGPPEYSLCGMSS